ncbi:SUMF1/EgtB/PvdO family nonheme iron enzyme [Peterkaempfera sp. SMS 1(5)a]|uniref:SUMF1/EgtB/PvdO family nonheme iron enzyme n=1 Tax=Peterkaempfera podocarpi TaxID=3232308 RepID=UPI003671FD37
MSGGPGTASRLTHPRTLDLPTPVPLQGGADLSALDAGKILAAPDDPADWPAWRDALTRWRREARDRLRYDPAHYLAPQASWAAHAVSMCVAWLWDETLYDRRSGAFTPDAFLDAGERDFGGFDAVVLWNGYPFLGVDGRDQFACFTAVPDLPDLVRALHTRGVRVLAPYNPWDTGTGYEDPAEHAKLLAELVARLDLDGVFLDTLRGGDDQLLAAVQAARPGTVFETESAVPTSRIDVHLASWAQWWADSEVPGVPRARWYEPRHMTHQTRRWHRDHAGELHSAWLSGSGVLIWENVFGARVTWNDRDRSLLRALLPARRHFAEHFTSGDWQPLADSASPRLPAARFTLGTTTVWTVANRTGAPYQGPLLDRTADPALRWYDAVAGTPLGDDLVGTLPRDGVACVVALPPDEADAPQFRALLAHARTTARGWSDDTAFPTAPLLRTPVPYAPHTRPPVGTAAVPGGTVVQRTVHQVRECGLPGQAPFVNAWKPLPPLLHQDSESERTVQLGSFAIAVHEVTNAQYAAFLQATGYTPVRSEGFLAHWRGSLPSADTETRPVVCVDLDDARAYARWAGLRLPTPAEWQAAAENGLLSRADPLVWNWTESESSDGRTRSAVLKGGAAHRTQGSEWYAPGGPRPAGYELPLPLPAAGLDRFTTVGFRCAADLVEHPAPRTEPHQASPTS